MNKAYNSKNEDAIPIDPLASRKLDAIDGHLIEVFTILGLRLIPNIDGGEVDPTPTAAPVERKGIIYGNKDDGAECVAIIKQVQVMKSNVCILLGSLLKF